MEAEDDDQAAEHTDDPLDGFDAERILARTQGRAGWLGEAHPQLEQERWRTPVTSPDLGPSGCGSLPGSSKTTWLRNCEATGPTRHPGSSGGARGGWVGRRSRTRPRRVRKAR